MNGPTDGSIDSGLQISSGKSANILLISGDANLRSEWYGLLRAMGYSVVRDHMIRDESERLCSDLVQAKIIKAFT